MHKGLLLCWQNTSVPGATPSTMNLTDLKHELGDEYDVYIINESGIIEFTSYEPDRGLDFKKIPYFFEYLTRIRNSEGFFPDRIVQEQTGWWQTP